MEARSRDNISSKYAFISLKVLYCPKTGYHDFILVYFLSVLSLDRASQHQKSDRFTTRRNKRTSTNEGHHTDLLWFHNSRQGFLRRYGVFLRRKGHDWGLFNELDKPWGTSGTGRVRAPSATNT